MVEHLPSMGKALGPVPGTGGKETNTEREREMAKAETVSGMALWWEQQKGFKPSPPTAEARVKSLAVL